MNKVHKETIESYHVNCHKFEGWGVVVLMFGKEYAHVIIDSDYGCFSAFWARCGGCPRNYLVTAKFDSIMRNLANGNINIPAPEMYPQQVKERIGEAFEYGNLTEEERDIALKEMIDTEFQHGDLYQKELLDHALFDKVFGEFDALPDAEKEDPRLRDLWNNVWLPFVEQLKEELTETKKS